MNILSIDSITPILSVSAQGPLGMATVVIDIQTQHAENIVSVMEKSLQLAGFTAKDTNLVVCAEGPGSFTGLRLAYATAKAIQLAANCPLYPVPPLPCYAESFSTWPGAVISVLDAKKNRFYAQVFRRGSPVTEAMDISEVEIMQFVDNTERILITGPDALLFSEELQQHIPGLDICTVPTGKEGISTALLRFAENQFSNYTEYVPDHCGPVYVRKSDAETNISGK